MEHDYVIISDEDESLYWPWGELGRRLAASMIQPLRRRLDYTGIARKIFQVQQLPDGALPTYDRKVDV